MFRSFLVLDTLSNTELAKVPTSFKQLNLQIDVIFLLKQHLYLTNYLFLFFIVFILFFVCILLVLLSIFLGSFNDIDSNLLSIYECGFMPFEDARIGINIKFYLVSVLYIIFDLEIVLIFPWAVKLTSLGLFGFYSMIFFLVILTIVFIYEWAFGLLDWYTRKDILNINLN